MGDNMISIDLGTTNNKKEFYIPREVYAKSKVYPLWATQRASITTEYKNSQINTMMKNPSLNYKQLQKVSNYLFGISSAYQNIAYYLATMMTYDWMIVPKGITQNQKTMMNRFESAAKKVHMVSPSTIYPMMTLRTIVNGETYWYDLSDSENTIYKEINSEFCQLAMIDDDNLWRYFIDLSLLKPDNLYEMPSEIKMAHDKWISGGKSKKKASKNIDGIMMEIPDNLFLVGKRGFSMHVHMTNSQHDYPFLASMFKDFNELENSKEYTVEVTKDQNVKLVHLKIPTDAEGVPLMDYDDIQAYHQSAKDHLPDNVAPLTNPFEVQAITLDKSQQSAINLVEHSQNVVQSDSGISETLFNSSSVNSLGYSIKTDASKMYPLLQYFNNLITYRLKEEKFSCTFLKVTHYDKEDIHKQYATDLANGGSRFMFISTSHLDIYEYLQTLKLEQMFNIDELMPAKMNANQMSSEEENGRPELEGDDKAEATVKGEDNN